MEPNISLYPVSSERMFARPKASKERQQKEKIQYDREKPIISSVLEHLHKQVDFYSNIKSVKHHDDPEKFMHEVNANQIVVSILESEISKLERIVKMYDK